MKVTKPRVVFPICATLVEQGRWERLLLTLHVTLAGVIALGLVAALGVELLADDIIRVVFTSTYDESADVLRVLFLGACALYAATVGDFVIASLHRDRLALVAMLGGATLKVAFNAWVVPAHGAMGAAWATVASLSVSGSVLCVFAYRSVLSGAARSSDTEPKCVEVMSP